MISTSQKRDHALLVREQKKTLDSLLIKMNHLTLTIRGHIALSMFKDQSIVIPDLKALQLQTAADVPNSNLIFLDSLLHKILMLRQFLVTCLHCITKVMARKTSLELLQLTKPMQTATATRLSF